MKINPRITQPSKTTTAKTTIKTSLIFFFRLAAQAATLYIFAKMLGANEFSIYAAITAVALLLGVVANLGFNTLAIYEIGSNLESQEELISYAIPSIIIFSFFLQIVFYLTVLLIGWHSLNSISIIAVGFTEITIIPLLTLNSVIIYAKNKIILSQIISTIPILIRLVISVIIYLKMETITANDLLHVHIYIGASCLIIIVIFIYKENLYAIKYKLISKKQMMRCLKYSNINFLSIALSEADKPLASSTLSAPESGVYALCTRIIGAVTLPINALIISTLNQLLHHKNTIKKTSYSILITTLIYSIGATIAMYFISSMISPVFGDSYFGLSTSLIAISIAIPGICLRISASSILMAKKMVSQRILIEFIGLVIIICLMLSINRSYNINGAIYSLVLGEWFMAIAGWSLLIKKL